MSDTSDAMEVKVLGKVIGTASGWDPVEECHVQFYSFHGAKTLPREMHFVECLAIDFTSGIYRCYDADANLDNSPHGLISEAIANV